LGVGVARVAWGWHGCRDGTLGGQVRLSGGAWGQALLGGVLLWSLESSKYRVVRVKGSCGDEARGGLAPKLFQRDPGVLLHPVGLCPHG
jgi:hypothetical protein